MSSPVNNVIHESSSPSSAMGDVELSVKAVKDQAALDIEKYFSLFWFARTSSPDPAIATQREEAMSKYPEESNKLYAETSDWQHGFNSGMLAASRMYGGLAVSSEDDVWGGYHGEGEGTAGFSG